MKSTTKTAKKSVRPRTTKVFSDAELEAMQDAKTERKKGRTPTARPIFSPRSRK